MWTISARRSDCKTTMIKVVKSLFSLRSYGFKFDKWALLLCLLVLLPTFVWMAFPVPDDLLRIESCTPVWDTVGSVFQTVMMAALCLLRNRQASSRCSVPLRWSIVAMLLLYWLAWFLYYAGFFNMLILMLLVVPPCLCFFLFAWERRNAWALLAAIGFLCCHLVFAVMNFL